MSAPHPFHKAGHRVPATAIDRTIAFQRPFVAITESITAALMLSQAWYWIDRVDRDDALGREGWFHKTRDEWQAETGMTRYEQEGARKRLVERGFLEEARRGVPAQLYYRVNVAAVAAALAVIGGGGGGHQLDGGKPTNLTGPQPAGGNPPTQLGENPPSLKGTQTTSQTTQRLNPLPPPGASPKGNGERTRDSEDQTVDGLEPWEVDRLQTEAARSRSTRPAGRSGPAATDKVETEIPETFAVTDAMRQWARTRGLTDAEIDVATEQFVNRAIDSNRMSFSWPHAWRNWMLNEPRDGARGGRSPRSSREAPRSPEFTPPRPSPTSPPVQRRPVSSPLDEPTLKRIAQLLEAAEQSPHRAFSETALDYVVRHLTTRPPTDVDPTLWQVTKLTRVRNHLTASAGEQRHIPAEPPSPASQSA